MKDPVWKLRSHMKILCLAVNIIIFLLCKYCIKDGTTILGHLFQQICEQDLSHAAELGNQKLNLSLGQAISAKLHSITSSVRMKVQNHGNASSILWYQCSSREMKETVEDAAMKAPWTKKRRNLQRVTSKVEKKLNPKLIDCGTFHH